MNKRASTIAKGIAVLMLLSHHLFYSNEKISVLSGNQGLAFWPFSQELIIQVSQSFKTCVSIFVFITGYGVYRQIEERFSAKVASKQLIGCDLASYSISRLAKLYSGFWIIFLFAHLLGFLLGRWTLFDSYGGNGNASGILKLIIDFSGLSDLFGTATYNDTWWYLSLAIILIFITPLLSVAAIKIGALPILMLSFMIPLSSEWGMGRLWRYSFALSLGIFCAKTQMFERVGSRFSIDEKPMRRLFTLIVSALLIIGFLAARQKAESIGTTWMIEALAATMICFSSGLLAKAPCRLLALFGRHSMNIFLIHTFIYKYFFREVIASGHYFIIVFLLLATLSLLSSLLIERLKSEIGYNVLSNRLISKVKQLVYSLESNS